MDKKLEFIKSLPDIHKVNPYMSIRYLQDVKKMLCDAGFYKIQSGHICDSAIINLILVAQGKKKMHVPLEKKHRASVKKIYMDNGEV